MKRVVHTLQGVNRLNVMVSITTREKLLIIKPLAADAQKEHEYKTALKKVKQTLKHLAK